MTVGGGTSRGGAASEGSIGDRTVSGRSTMTEWRDVTVGTNREGATSVVYTEQQGCWWDVVKAIRGIDFFR